MPSFWDVASKSERSALTWLVRAFKPGAWVALPRIAGIAPLVLARALYRRWLANRGWRPLVYVEPRFLSAKKAAEQLDECLAQAADGLLLLGADLRRDDALDSAALEARARELGVALLVPGSEELAVGPASVTALLRDDAHHLIACDPSLDELRRAVLAYCRARVFLHLFGQPGTGRRSLARWAHAELSEQPLAHVRPGTSTRVVPGRWLLYEQLSELEPAQLAPLRSQIRLREPSRLALSVDAGKAPERPEHPALAPLIGESPALRRLLAKVARYAPSTLPLLVLGETGTGKELIARAIHALSGRQGKFVAIDLSTRSETFIESALFGHVRGAYTGASKARAGAAREAEGGTLFLDELGNLSLGTQAKLLRLMEQREVQALGSDEVVRVDVRIVAATNVDLEEMVRTGSFRGDLLFRFNPSAVLHIPALRERTGDIGRLARHFLPDDVELSPAALTRLEQWPWPGNVRELRHIMEAAALECSDDTIEERDLGVLSPGATRTAPVLVVSSEEPAERDWGLTRSELQRLTAVTLQLAPLADRGRLAVRHAVLSQLGGRPIETRALRVLEGHPWWGNCTELAEAMAAVRGSIDGPVGISALELQLPHLVHGGERSPIRVMLFPSLHNGRLVGLERQLTARSVLVGRAASLRELRPSGDDPRLAKRWAALEEHAGGGPVGLLNLSFLGRLSRAHFVLVRERGGVVVHRLPGALLRVLAGPLERDGLFEVRKGRPVEIGEAGEVQVIEDGQERPYLQLLVFAGALAPETFGPRVAERFTAAPAERTLGVQSKRLQIWKLAPDEGEALVGALLEAVQRPCSLAAHLRSAARTWLETDPSLGDLAGYLDSSHPTQSCTRLIAHAENEELRSLLSTRLAAHDEGEALWLKLPVGVRRVIAKPS